MYINLYKTIQNKLSTNTFPLRMTKEQYLYKLTSLIRDKDWLDKDFSKECLERLSAMNTILDADDRQMIVDLMQKFDKFFIESYVKMLKNVFLTIPKEKFSQEKVFICGMVKFEDRGKIKSGPALAYLTHALKYHSFFLNKSIKTEPLSFDLLSKIGPDSLLIIVDDFLGSGDTFFKMSSYFQLNTMKDFIIVISLVSMEEGYNKIKNAGFNIYTNLTRKKGISELMPESKRDEYLKMMKKIEKKINVRSDFSLGYKQSESLISMIRTPNNTFPVFWEKNKFYDPPFER